MTTGTMRRRLTESAVGTLLWLLSTTASAVGWDEQALLQALSQQAEPVVHFSETRHLQYLDVPLTTSGELEFRPPDFLRRTVNSGDSFQVSGGRLTMQDAAGARREIGLDAYPGLRAFVESFRATLSGDLTVLHRYFQTDLQGTRQKWELRLTPRDAAIARVIARISMFGADGRLYRIETYERGGDYTVTQLGEQR